MDPAAEEQLDYGDDEFVGAQKIQYRGAGTISALLDDEIIGEDEYDDLYNDVNVGEGFLQLQHSEAPLPPASVSKCGFLEPKEGLTADAVQVKTTNITQTERVHGLTNDAQKGNLAFEGSNPAPHNTGVGSGEISVKVATESAPLLKSVTGSPRVVPLKPDTIVNVNHAMVNNENQVRTSTNNGSTILFVGNLHWWTTDAELESVLSQYGRVKEINFFEEKASGKSKGYCQVEFYDSSSASSCKQGMNGYNFNGQSCVVAFASSQTVRQMATSYMNKKQPQTQPQTQLQGRRPMNDGVARGGGMNQPSGDGGRNYGRGWWGRGQGVLNRGPGVGPMRGRGGAKAYQQGLRGPAFGGLMPSQGMMGAGFDPTFLSRGAGYGGFPGSTFPGMIPSFQGVNPMGLSGVAPHVNPAFFGRGMVSNAMQMMGPTGMDVHHAGMWTDTSMGAGGGEEHGDRRTRESSYGGEDGVSEYGYGERDRSNRNYTYMEEKDGYRQRERDEGYEDDWDRGRSSSRSRSRSNAILEEVHRRSRDVDYGKRRRLPSE